MGRRETKEKERAKPTNIGDGDEEWRGGKAPLWRWVPHVFEKTPLEKARWPGGKPVRGQRSVGRDGRAHKASVATGENEALEQRWPT